MCCLGLAVTMDWHRREKKATWWEYFRLSGLPAEELFDERGDFRAELCLLNGRGAYPPLQLSAAGCRVPWRGSARSSRSTFEHRLVDIKKQGDTAGLHPEAVFEFSDVPTQVRAESLVKIGEHVADPVRPSGGGSLLPPESITESASSALGR